MRTFDTSLRLQTLEGKNASRSLQGVLYGYDTAGRLSSVSTDGYAAAYSYAANSLLLSGLAMTIGAGGGLVTTKVWDKLNRLTSISSKPYGSSATNLPVSFAYQHNAANQRTLATLGDGSYWVYQYDSLRQAISGKRFWSDGTAVAGQQFEYGFDDIGNRTGTKAGGEASGGSLRSASYGANNLNQYTNRTVPGAVEVVGIANVGATVTVNGASANRHGEYYRKEVGVDNSYAAQFPVLTNSAALAGVGTNTTTGAVFVAKSPEALTYALDGNLTSDGRWTNSWDGESRLIQMVSLTNAPPASKRWLKFEYDWQGRRILKTACVWTNNAWLLVVSNEFLYDLSAGQAGGWNLLAELNATNNSPIRSYLWGLDLSATEQGAGGVGGLVCYGDRQATTYHFPAYDGNGNVAALVSAGDGSLTARYDCGPFAEPIRATGPAAKANPFRFSTKYRDDETATYEIEKLEPVGVPDGSRTGLSGAELYRALMPVMEYMSITAKGERWDERGEICDMWHRPIHAVLIGGPLSVDVTLWSDGPNGTNEYGAGYDIVVAKKVGRPKAGTPRP